MVKVKLKKFKIGHSFWSVFLLNFTKNVNSFGRISSFFSSDVAWRFEYVFGDGPTQEPLRGHLPWGCNLVKGLPMKWDVWYISFHWKSFTKTRICPKTAKVPEEKIVVLHDQKLDSHEIFLKIISNRSEVSGKNTRGPGNAFFNA